MPGTSGPPKPRCVPPPRKPPRGRRRRACDSCSKKKIHCDTEFPQCNWCKHHNLACTYNRILRQANIRNQVSLPLTAKPGQLTFSSDNASAAPNLIPPESLGRLRWGNTFLNNMTYYRGHHIFSDEGRKWIESCVGNHIDFNKLCASEFQWLNPLHPPTDPGSRPIPDLPSRADVEGYVLLYGSSYQGLVFPVISKALFVKTLDLAYDPRRSFGSASAKSCVYSFLSIVALFGFDDNIYGAMDCGTYASAAQSFVAQIVEEMTVDGLQSLIMLVQLQYFLGDLQSAAVCLSIATRLLYPLGAHTVPLDSSATCLNTYNKSDIGCHLRDLFWLCYSFDKDICLRTGQPPCINDTHCDLTLPSEYVPLRYFDLQNTEVSIDHNHTMPIFPWDLRLSKLKSKVYQELYCASAHHKSVPELLSSIRSLDETLEQWRLSLPQDLRPTLYFSREMPVSANMNTQVVMLRLAYYHCVTTIHQASSRCQLSGTDFAGGKFDGVTSSISLAIEASRSTLSYIQRALPVVKGECFWIVLFYAITAVLTLFCNILSNPLDASSHHDVNMLHSVPGLIRSIPIRRFTLAEVIHLKFLDGFTTELAGLCVCAMSKARQRDGLSQE